GADLDLDRLAGMSDDRGVQGLVAVGLRHRDVVLEAAWHRLPEGVHDPQDAVAIAHRLNLDPNRRQVVDLGEVLALAGHLLPDRVDVFRPPGDIGLYAHLLELAAEDLAQVGDQRLALVALPRDPFDDIVVRLGLEVAEGEVFELPLDLADAEPVSQRGVDVERLVRDLAALGLGEWLQRP